MSLSVDFLLYRRYRIIHLLGQGGMGAVYRAWDTHIDADVAVKELIAQTDDEKELEKLQEQFQQEARVLARLNHPNLVRVTDFFQEEGNAYLVMNFVEGQSLAQKIASEGALSEALVLKWAAQLLSALDYCHARNVIHRDIKPENVIIRPKGQAVLVDFGLMKLWDPDDPKTKTIVRGMGTPAYAPPEQYDVVIGSTTPRSDVYSFGATLYHTLVGQSPPTASYRMAYPEQFALTWPAPLDISSQTRAVVEQAMEIATSQRWPSALAMAEALGVDVSGWDTTEDHLASSSTLPGDGGTRKITPPEAHVPKQGLRRLPIWGWGIILLGLAGLIVGVGTVFKVFTPAAVLSPTPTPALTLTPSVTPTPAPTATRTSAPTATRTPTPRPTATKRATATYSPTPELTDTPVPAGLTPESILRVPSLLYPQQGQVYKSPVFFRWDGVRGTGQAYVLHVWHVQSGHRLPDATVTSDQLTVDLPADKYGEWRWTVSVVRGDTVLGTSNEGTFWFDPFLGIDFRGGSSPLATPQGP